MKNTSIRILAILLLGSFFVSSIAFAQNGAAAIPIDGDFQNANTFLLLSAPPCKLVIVGVGGQGDVLRSGSADDKGNRETTFEQPNPNAPAVRSHIYPNGSTDSTAEGIGRMTSQSGQDFVNKYAESASLEQLQQLKAAFDKAVAQAEVETGGYDDDPYGDFTKDCKPVADLIDQKIKEKQPSIDSDGDGVPDSEEVGSIRTGGEEVVTISGEESPFDIIITEDEAVVAFTDGDIDRPLVLGVEGTPNVLAIVNPGPDILKLEVLVASVAIAPDSAVVFTSPSGDSLAATLAPGESLYAVVLGEPLAAIINGAAMDVGSLVGRYSDAASLYSAASNFAGFAGFGGDLGFGDFGGGFGGGHSINDSDYDRALQSAQQTVDTYGSSEAAKIGGSGGSGFIQVGGVGGFSGVTIDPRRASMAPAPIQTNTQGGVVTALQRFQQSLQTYVNPSFQYGQIGTGQGVGGSGINYSSPFGVQGLNYSGGGGGVGGFTPPSIGGRR